MAEPRRRDPKTGAYLDYDADRSKAEHEGILDREKVDPSLKKSGMTQEQIQASGGLGAYAAAHQAKRPATTGNDAAVALAMRKKPKGTSGGY
jgi:hypothetical protein